MVHCHMFLNVPVICVGVATKRLRILSLGGIDKIRNHLVANPIYRLILLNS